MSDLTPNHPAVKAADREYDLRDCITDDAPLTVMSDALTSALPHLTADDLRDTPAGRALMAEAWTRCADHPALKATGLSGTLHHHNPYR